jgi:hypothetical protein
MSAWSKTLRGWSFNSLYHKGSRAFRGLLVLKVLLVLTELTGLLVLKVLRVLLVLKVRLGLTELLVLRVQLVLKVLLETLPT